MERMLTPRDVAERYRVSIESVWRWIRNGRLPAISLTKRIYRIRPADLEAFEIGVTPQVNENAQTNSNNMEKRFICPIFEYGLRKTKTIKEIIKQVRTAERNLLSRFQKNSLAYRKKNEYLNKPITFGEAIDMYVSRLKETGKDSEPVKIVFHLIKKRFKEIIIRYDNNTELLNEFTTWKQQLIREGKKPATINRYTAVVQTTMNLLKKLNMIQDNPITSLRFPKLKHYPRDRILTPEEESKLLETVKHYKPYLFPLVQFCLIIPSRWKCELLYATVEQYQRDNNVIIIPASRSKAKIPIYKPIPKELQNYFNNLPATQRYIFFDKHLSFAKIWRDFKECCIDANIGNSFTLHDLRHCAVSKLVNNGNNSWDICSVTGWTTPKQLTTYYHFDRLQSATRLKF